MLDIEADENPEQKASQGAGNADRGSGHEKDPLHAAARGPHGAQDGDVMPLILYQHDEARNDIEGGDQDDERQDQEHHIALDSERAEEGLVALLPRLDIEVRPRRIE